MKPLILHIDTTSPTGFVMLTSDSQILGSQVNENPLEHASFLQPAIKRMLSEHSIEGSLLSAVSVANGPGSYTGLRVGLAAAKGLCYAWNKPLIALNSLKIMAKATKMWLEESAISLPQQSCLAPMIDARRLEVFYAVYNFVDLSVIIEPVAGILTAEFLSQLLTDYEIYFSGDGTHKWKTLCKSKNARFALLPDLGKAMASLAFEAFNLEKFSEIAYLEPQYLKAFYSNK